MPVAHAVVLRTTVAAACLLALAAGGQAAAGSSSPPALVGTAVGAGGSVGAGTASGGETLPGTRVGGELAFQGPVDRPRGDAAEPATIDTYRAWRGSYVIWPFGHPDTSTYGQVVTVPASTTSLERFRFYLTRYDGTGPITLRGLVYAWTGDRATGAALWESDPRSMSFGTGAFRRVGFDTGGVELETGRQYVLFATVSKDYEETRPDSRAQWAFRRNDPYPGGNAVWLNDSGDESRWTTEAWDDGGRDFAFKAWFD